MPILICPDCAFGTDDAAKDTCDYCKSKLIHACPACGSPIMEKKSIYCRSCGQKLRVSIIPIQ